MNRPISLLVVVAVLSAATLAGCGGGSTDSSLTAVSPPGSPSPLSAPTPSPTVEEVAEPTPGAFRSGYRVGMNLRVSDNTTTRGITTGSQDFLAPSGWQPSGGWIENSALKISPVYDRILSPNPVNTSNDWRLKLGSSLAPGTVLTRGFYALVRTGEVEPNLVRSKGDVWEMTGGQIIIEENGATNERPEIRRLRLRLRGVRMATLPDGFEAYLYDGSENYLPSVFDGLLNDNVLYSPGAGHFTVNGIIVVEQDTSYDPTYIYTGSVEPYVPLAP